MRAFRKERVASVTSEEDWETVLRRAGDRLLLVEFTAVRCNCPATTRAACLVSRPNVAVRYPALVLPLQVHGALPHGAQPAAGVRNRGVHARGHRSLPGAIPCPGSALVV